MKLEDIEKLCAEALQDYREGYEKAYRNIPDLVYELRALSGVAQAATSAYESYGSDDDNHGAAILALKKSLKYLEQG